jgi:hypothetical protein
VHRGAELAKTVALLFIADSWSAPISTECISDSFGFEPVEGREVLAAFDGGAISSDAGALLLGATDRAIAMMDRFAKCFHDARRPDLIEHEVVTLVSQRVLGMPLGDKDLNDHDELRHDAMASGPQPLPGAALPPASPQPQTRAARLPDTRRRNASQTRHHPTAYRDHVLAVATGPEKFPVALASSDATRRRAPRKAKNSPTKIVDRAKIYPVHPKTPNSWEPCRAGNRASQRRIQRNFRSICCA